MQPCPPLRHIWGTPIALTGAATLAQTTTGMPLITDIFGSDRDGVAFDAHGAEGQHVSFPPGTFSNMSPGTEMTISLEGDSPTEDAARSGMGAGKVSLSSFNVMRVAPGPNGTGTCTGIRIKDRATGLSRVACLADGQEIEVHSTELASVGWGDFQGEGGSDGTGGGIRHTLHLQLAAPADMILPDGTHFRGDSIDIDENDFAPGAAVDTFSFSWGLSQAGYGVPMTTGLSRVTTTVNGLVHECAGPDGTINANPGRVTISNIGSSGQDGVEIKWPADSTAALGVDITPVCGGDSSSGCDTTMQQLYLRAHGTYSDGNGRSVSTSISGSPSSFFDIFCDFAEVGVDQVQATVIDESGSIVDQFDVPHGTPIHAVTNGGRFAHCDTSALRVNDKASMQLMLRCSNSASFGVAGSPPVTGRLLLLTSVQNPYSLRSFDSLTITGSGMSELDVSDHTLVPETGPYCPADFNLDGGVDGADVSAFFESWENGLADADVNQDGGVDGSDIDTFFRAWENGGC